ncbi:MAG: flagellar hook-basal body complex protein FliE [Beijerinckiaceae bacterium]|nr:flagellar hook-basal body complex protein FliE [Beijerinckiaceae bacterium]
MQFDVSHISRLGVSGSQVRGPAAPVDQELFSAMLKDAAADAIGIVKGAEKMAISGLLGNASINDVVHNVMAAERSFHTILAIRDKAVSAYQEISRLQI